MDAVRIREVAEAGEDLRHEFKRANPKDQLSDETIVNAVVCMANSEGGTVLLGIEDDGTVSGCAPRHGAMTIPSRLQAMVRVRTEPPLPVSVAVVPVDSVQVTVITVPAAAHPVQTSQGSFPRRQLDVHGEPQCHPMTAAEIEAMTLTTGDVDFAT